jgi:hypothetical protein
MEKHELVKRRNEQLERTNIDKENLYANIKSENDGLLD